MKDALEKTEETTKEPKKEKEIKVSTPEDYWSPQQKGTKKYNLNLNKEKCNSGTGRFYRGIW